MDELTPEARAILTNARPSFEPSAEQLARLRARAAEVPESWRPDDGGVSASATSTSSWGVYVIVAAAVAVAVAAVVAWSSREPQPPVEAPVPASTPQHVGLVAPRIDAIAVPPPPVDVEAVPSDRPPLERLAPRPPDEVARRVRARAQTSSPSPRPPAMGDTDSLTAQLELIGGARRAIAASAWAEAHRLVERYHARFPDGAFTDEAHVIDLLAECGARPGPDSRARAEAWLTRPSAPFVERVRARCL